jgi:FixJ family two-component response regulator
MSWVTPIVFVVDDDVSIREALELHFRLAGWQRRIFRSAEDFIAYPREHDPIGIRRSEEALSQQAAMEVLRQPYASLNHRERDVMSLVVSGHLNEQVGAELNLSEITVKAHRGELMREMNARSLADLVAISEKLGLTPSSDN